VATKRELNKYLLEKSLYVDQGDSGERCGPWASSCTYASNIKIKGNSFILQMITHKIKSFNVRINSFHQQILTVILFC
jgi:hypothetical protein